MAQEVQLRRGTTTEHNTFTGAAGELTVDTTKNTAVIHDGSTAGGYPLQKEGVAGDLNSLTDVTIVSIQNNDLLMYNSVATKWQNTNLGVTVTPTLTGDPSITGGLSYTVTVSNNATYQDPAYFCEVYTGASLVIANSAVTDNQDGTLSFTAPVPAGTHEIRVKCQDFGDLQSEVGTLAFTTTAFGGNFRYWKITGITCTHPNWWMLANMRLFDAAGQSGTAYPANMTSATAPSPYVIVAGSNYNSGYTEWKAFDSNTTNSFYWAIGSPYGPADWLTIDLGSAVDVKSMTITGGNSSPYVPTGFLLYASPTGVFGGEQTLIHTASGLPSVSGQVTNIG
jgi:hypothetical protein